MHLTVKSLLFFGIIFATSLMATGPRVSPNLISVEKNIVYALDLPPFISTEVVNGGALSEIIVAAFADQKTEVVINIIPLQSMLQHYLFEENILAITGRHMGIEKEKNTDIVSIPLFISDERYVYYKPRQKKLTAEDIASNGKKLTYGASDGEDVTLFQKKAIKVHNTRPFSMLKKLKQGKIDFISLPLQSAQWYIQNKYASEKNDFVIMQSESRTAPIAVCFNLKNKKGKQFVELFKKGLKNIVENGVYAQILEKHNIDGSIIQLQQKHIKNAVK